MRRDAVLGLPLAWLKVEQLELDRQALAGMGDEGVHACDEGGRDRFGVGGVAFPLGLHVASIANEAGHAVALDVVGPEDFGQLAGPGPAPDLDLVKTVLRGHETLGEEQIVDGFGVDVGDAPLVAKHFDGLFEPGKLQRAFNLSQTLAGFLFDPSLRLGLRLVELAAESG